MNKTHLLNEILSVLHTIKDDGEKLSILHNFIISEIYEEIDEEIEIPKKYKKLISDVAEDLIVGFNCYINANTLEYESFPQEMDFDLSESETEESINENDYKHLQWETCITIEPLSSNDSFTIMEKFVQIQDDNAFANKLLYALEHKKPFANFNHLINNSKNRNSWFDFRKNETEYYVYQEFINYNKHI